MIINNRVVGQTQGGYGVSTKSLSRSSMEKFGITVPELELSDGAALFPIEFFIIEEGDEMFLKNYTEICLRTN